jgi:hypothetical protein
MKSYELDDPTKIADMARSRAYGLVREFLLQSLTRTRVQLELPGNEAATAALRGEIKGLKQALEAPDLVIREIREAVKRKKLPEGE